MLAFMRNCENHIQLRNAKYFFSSPKFLTNHLDYYKSLGINRSATKNEIKKAYFQLAKRHHPDVNTGNPSAKQKFQEIAEAYTVLSDDAKRKHYDWSSTQNYSSFKSDQK